MLAPNELDILLVICCVEGSNWRVIGNLQPQESNSIIQPPKRMLSPLGLTSKSKKITMEVISNLLEKNIEASPGNMVSLTKNRIVRGDTKSRSACSRYAPCYNWDESFKWAPSIVALVQQIFSEQVCWFTNKLELGLWNVELRWKLNLQNRHIYQYFGPKEWSFLLIYKVPLAFSVM